MLCITSALTRGYSSVHELRSTKLSLETARTSQIQLEIPVETLLAPVELSLAINVSHFLAWNNGPYLIVTVAKYTVIKQRI